MHAFTQMRTQVAGDPVEVEEYVNAEEITGEDADKVGLNWNLGLISQALLHVAAVLAACIACILPTGSVCLPTLSPRPACVHA